MPRCVSLVTRSDGASGALEIQTVTGVTAASDGLEMAIASAPPSANAIGATQRRRVLPPGPAQHPTAAGR